MEFLKQLVKSLQDAEIKLEEAYNKKDREKFNNTKSLMLKLQSQIQKKKKK